MQSKSMVIVIIILVVILGGYFLLRGGNQASVSTPVEVPAEEAMEPAGSNTEVSEQVSGGEVKEFNMTAKKWEFSPGTITVNKGDTVKLHIESTDVAHGFGLPAFSVNERLEPGETVDVEFVADKTGIFTFSCTVSCGSGHSGMKGQLIVE